MLWWLSFAELTSWGVLGYAFSVLLLPMQRDLGWSLPAITGGYALALAVSGLAGIGVGRLIDRGRVRAVMTGGAVLGASVVAAWSQVGSLAAWYALCAGMGVAMAMVLYEPAFALVTACFRRRRSAAFTLLTVVGALASVVYLPLTDHLVSRCGWRAALLVLGGLLAVITIPIHLLAIPAHPHVLDHADGEPPGDASEPGPGPGPGPGQMPGERPWWRLALGFALAALVTTAVSVHAVALFVSAGLDATSAAASAGLIAGMGIPGRLAYGALAARLGDRRIAACAILLMGLALAALALVPSPAAALVCVLLLGACSGVLSPARAALVAERAGTVRIGSANAAVALVITAARGPAPLLMAVLAAMGGGYRPALMILALLCAASSWLLLDPCTAAIASRQPRR